MCGPRGTVPLLPLRAITVPCTEGSLILPGNGASYLVVPNFAASTTNERLVTYTIGVVGGPAADVATVPRPSLDLMSFAGNFTLVDTLRRHQRQIAFDAALRNDAQHRFANGLRAPASVSKTRFALRSPNPPVGSIDSFFVLSSMNPRRSTRVGARLYFVGANIQLYVDTLAPPNGFTPAQLQKLGAQLDQTFYPLDANTFGAPTDIDGNGHVIVLLSPIVNHLSPAQCTASGEVLGFFDNFDLVPADTTSNFGEIFYGPVPDPNGTVSCAQLVSVVGAEIPVTFLHQLQHMINFGHHVNLNRGAPERGWLDEGLSLIAEELGSIHYEREFPPPTGRSNPIQLFPDSAQVYDIQMFASYAYLFQTDTASILFHADADSGFAWRGGDWLLLRWLGDHEGPGFYKTLVNNHLTGTENIANAAGEPFDGMFGDFSLSEYVDSIPGVPRALEPLRDRFTTRNLRQIYARMHVVGINNPRVFPIVPLTLTGLIRNRMVPGTMSFYLLNTTAGQDSVTIDFFGASPGSPVPASLHPQLSVFRFQ